MHTLGRVLQCMPCFDFGVGLDLRGGLDFPSGFRASIATGFGVDGGAADEACQRALFDIKRMRGGEAGELPVIRQGAQGRLDGRPMQVRGK
ncbi:hypothetical protein IWX63_001800 [Arthrobacter sp. CAN_A2]